MTRCTADEGVRCDGGDGGEPCAECREEERASMLDAIRSWPAEQARRSYREDMIDAGRGHLLPEAWEE